MMYEMRRRKPEPTLLLTHGIFNLPHHTGMVCEELALWWCCKFSYTQRGRVPKKNTNHEIRCYFKSCDIMSYININCQCQVIIDKCIWLSHGRFAYYVLLANRVRSCSKCGHHLGWSTSARHPAADLVIRATVLNWIAAQLNDMAVTRIRTPIRSVTFQRFNQLSHLPTQPEQTGNWGFQSSESAA